MESAAELDSLDRYLREVRRFRAGVLAHDRVRMAVKSRMEVTASDTVDDYVDYLQVHTDEYPALLEALGLQRQAFFRDGATWSALQERCLRALAEDRGPSEPVRCWVVGCGSGHDAYGLAMAWDLVLGPEAEQRVKIYATDTDPLALATAREAIYNLSDIEGVPPDLRERWFHRTPSNLRAKVDGVLRDRVTFGQHDIAHDPPITRVDLVMCRDVLAWRRPEEQDRILVRIQGALRSGGLLVTGPHDLVDHPGFAPLAGVAGILVRHDTPSVRAPASTTGTGAPAMAGHAAPALLRSLQQELIEVYGELEATTEELAARRRQVLAAVEDLERSNEALSQANADLEQLNSELISANEELSLANADQAARRAELLRTSGILVALLHAIEQPAVVVDTQLGLLWWSQEAGKRWHLRAEHTGQRLAEAGVGEELTALERECRHVLQHGEEATATLHRHAGETRVRLAPAWGVGAKVAAVAAVVTSG